MQRNIASVFIATLLFSNIVIADDINFMQQVAEGGIAIVVILALSILALAVSFERLIHFREKFIVPKGLTEQVKPLWAQRDFAQIQQLLNNQNNTLARIIQFMVKHRLQNMSTVSSGVGDLASIELRQHQQKAYALAIVATVAPIVGLLGTVVGMIEAFHVIAFSEGMGNPALLAGGISKALINTAAGLSVALPALGMHHFFKNKTTSLGLSLEKQVNELLNEWFMPVDAHMAPSHLQAVSHAH
jgi:biopolymer transport protein ExbB